MGEHKSLIQRYFYSIEREKGDKNKLIELIEIHCLQTVVVLILVETIFLVYHKVIYCVEM